MSSTGTRNSRAANPTAARLLGRAPHLLADPVVVEMAAHYWGLRSLYAEHELGFRARPADETPRDTIDWLRAHA